MDNGAKVASLILIVVSAAVLAYGAYDLFTDDGSLGPIGIGVIGVGLGVIFMGRASGDGNSE